MQSLKDGCRFFVFLLIFSVFLAWGASGSLQQPVMTVEEALALPSPPPDEKVFYGEEKLQFGELRLPEGSGPHPVAIVIHGGCWLSEYDIGHIGALAEALTESGIATWSLEYRRVGDPGGGWPTTFSDVAQGADHLRILAGKHGLDLSRLIAIGHSAGGHLALWLAARKKIPSSSPLHSSDPIPLAGVLGLAPAADLGFLHGKGVCGNVVDKLMGGSPANFPDRYASGSPAAMVPLGTRQILLGGTRDRNWLEVGRVYYQAARQAGDPVEWIEAAESGHFEMIDPGSTTWPLVLAAAGSLLSPPPR